MLANLEKKHIRGINLLLVILLGISLGYLFSSCSRFYLGQQTVETATPSPQKVAHSRQPTLQSYQSVLENNLFDPLSRKKQQTDGFKEELAKPQTAPSKRANLVLLGTVASKENPLAVIQTSRGPQIFHLEEKLSDGGKVEEIIRNEVTIRDRDGSLYTLGLPKTSMSSNHPRQQKASGNDSGIKEVSENNWLISSQAAENARGKFDELLKHARMEPKMVNGEMEGFEIKMIRSRSFLGQLGLKRGDVLHEINGIKLDSAEKALQIYGQLKEARNVSVALSRKGENLTFEYEVE